MIPIQIPITRQNVCGLLISLLIISPLSAQESTSLDPREASQFARSLRLDAVTPETFDSVRVVRDLAYVKYGDEDLRLDLYLPQTVEQPPPTVVVIVGGGFRSRSKEAFAPIAAYWAVHGFAAASISYRGVTDAAFPAAIDDAKAAVRYLRRNAQKFQLDPTRIAACGQSAGGYLAGMLAVSAGIESFAGPTAAGKEDVSLPRDDVALKQDDESRIQAAVTLAGVFDFISRLRDGGQQTAGLASKRQTNGAWIGEPFAEASEVWRRASPINYVSADDPPLLLVHCHADPVVPVEQSMQMFEAIRHLQANSRLVILEHDAQGQTPFRIGSKSNQQAWREAISFLREVLDHQPSAAEDS